MSDKKLQLEELKKEIEKNSINWLFPVEKGVQGFMGTGGEKRIMFVAERPSSKGRGKESYREKFYEVLKRNNLEDSHITDLIKSRAKVGELPPDDVREDRRIFKCEIDITEPKLIFALGNNTYKRLILSGWAENKIALVKQIHHYSYVFRFDKGGIKEKEFETQIQEALTEINK